MMLFFGLRILQSGCINPTLDPFFFFGKKNTSRLYNVLLRSSSWSPLGCFPILGVGWRCDKWEDLFTNYGHMKNQAYYFILTLEFMALKFNDLLAINFFKTQSNTS